MKRRDIFLVLTVACVLAVSSARAQEPQQPLPGGNQSTDPNQPISPLQPQDNTNDNRQTPAPAARGLFLNSNAQDQQGQILPDTHPLSGAITPGLGTTQGRRLFDPAFHITEGVDSGVGSTNSLTSIGGSLTFDESWNRYRLSAAYSGAQVFYAPASGLSRAYHNVLVSQEIHWNRWNFLLYDGLLISPESGFGDLYTGIPGLLGQTDITPVLQPGDTILTGRATRLNNTSVGEIDYSLTRRTSVTVSGSYSLLHFTKPGYIGNRTIGARAGYNYELSSRNTLALIYTYSAIRFSGSSAGQDTHLAQLSFGRKVTGRLSFQISAGPELTRFRNVSVVDSRRWSWGLSASLIYQMSRTTGYNFSYFHGVTAGSGVYFGSNTDTFTGTVTHRFTRFWSASGNAGYARNSDLVPRAGVAPRYNNWFAGGTVSRQIGREFRIDGVYAYQRQYNAPGICPVLTCGLPSTSRSLATVTLEWHPFAIQNEQ